MNAEKEANQMTKIHVQIKGGANGGGQLAGGRMSAVRAMAQLPYCRTS
jgi:hypothetical protein